MSKSNEFDPSLMDAILDSSEEQIFEIQNKIEEDKELMASKTEVDSKRVYGELENLIGLGKEILKNAKYAIEIDPTAEGALTGVASVINAVKDIVKEFTKVHLQNLKFEQQIQIEKLKQKGREKLAKMRKTEDTSDIEELVPYNQEENIRIIKRILETEKDFINK